MSSETYNAVMWVLASAGMAALLASAWCIISAIVGWRGPHRTRRLVRAAAFAAAFLLAGGVQHALLFWVFLPSLGREHRRAHQQRIDAASFVSVGDRAPLFRITTADGEEVALADLQGKVVLLNFFATWCGPCLLELPHVQDIWDEHRGRDDFWLLVVGREETDESVAAFRQQHGFTFPIAADPDRAVYSLFAEHYIPRTYLISRRGVIGFAATGFQEEDSDVLKTELAEQLRSSP